MSGSTIRLKSVEFRRHREPSWRQLEALVAKVESGSMQALDADELSRLPQLYRATISSLSVARAISLDRDLLEYLETLCGRAYVCVYGPRRHVWDALKEFFGRRFPLAIRRARTHVAAAALLLGLGAATGFTLTMVEPERFYAFVDEGMAQGRGPHETTEKLREALYSEGTRRGSDLTAFATFLLSHNARIGMLCFALGVVAGVPVVYLLFSNGLVLGAFAALYQQRGLGVEFWGWILPHGVTELLAVVLCAAAGLMVGESVVFPGPSTRMANLVRRGREAGIMVLGAVAMFFVAAIIEGVFRQQVHDLAARYGLVAASAALWSLYVVLASRESAE